MSIYGLHTKGNTIVYSAPNYNAMHHIIRKSQITNSVTVMLEDE